MQPIQVNIPMPSGSLQIEIAQGQTLVFIGANGGGKTRLGVYLEENITTPTVHRIGAQRALQFSTSISLIDYDAAKDKLFYGLNRYSHAHLTREQFPQQKKNSRWGSKPATHFVNDYEALLQALFADETRESVKYRHAMRDNENIKVPSTHLDRLQQIWHSLLPHRKLVVLDTAVKVSPTDGLGKEYDATELSDGERVIFYLIGQALLIPPNGTLIVDEPELHIHRALMATLWDVLESVKSDCAFIYFTHDLEFATSRSAAQKYVLRDYFGHPQPSWDIEVLPAGSDAIPEEVVCRIMGSRQAVLFVEGDNESRDVALYRRVYPSHTVIPVGSCDAVIRSVKTFNDGQQLHRLECVGLVDADDKSPDEQEYLLYRKIFTIPVCEVENLFLLPDVFQALAGTFGHDTRAAKELFDKLEEKVFEIAHKDEEKFALRYTKRRLDRLLKAIGLEAENKTELSNEFDKAIQGVNPNLIYRVVSDVKPMNLSYF